MSVRPRSAVLAVSVTMVALLAGCGSDDPAATSVTTSTTARPGSTSPSAAGGSGANTFVLDEWSVVPPAEALAAGKVDITAVNDGKETHELVIVRAADAAGLPKKDDGSVDEDEIPESKKAGEIADLAAGTSKTKTLDLRAGEYVAFCNIVEDMGKGDMGSGGMGSGGMGDGSTMGGGSGMGAGMHHVHFELGMVNYFTVA